jgi:hypothetical protein
MASGNDNSTLVTGNGEGVGSDYREWQRESEQRGVEGEEWSAACEEWKSSMTVVYRVWRTEGGGGSWGVRRTSQYGGRRTELSVGLGIPEDGDEILHGVWG